MGALWQPYREPLRATLLRTGAIAAALGAGLAWRWGGGLRGWAIGALLALWPAFGGHWVEVWFLNWLRPRLQEARIAQVAARLAVWFVAGALFTLCIWLTVLALGMRPGRWSPLWHGGLGGVAFVAIELIAHLVLQLRGRPSFYNGRG